MTTASQRGGRSPAPPAPAPRPCVSCPYRRDVPAGLWAANEYEKLPDYDAPIYAQPTAAFYCHQQDGRLCAGWLGCHHDHILSLRLGGLGYLEGYETDVPLFASGAEAAAHGMSGIENPDARARKMIDRLERKIAGPEPKADRAASASARTKSPDPATPSGPASST